MRLSTFALALVLVLLPILMPAARAGGDDAIYDSVEVSALPEKQGAGGTIVVRASARFYGGCCYHLFALNVRPSLEVPANVTVVSGPLPASVEKVDAQPGGIVTTADFAWEITSKVPGEYELKAAVSTDNCGALGDAVNVRYTTDVALSPPDAYPLRPDVSEDVHVSFALGGGKAVECTLFYAGVEGKGWEPENGTLRRGAATVACRPVALERREGKLLGRIPAPGSEALVAYYVKMADGANTTLSSAYYIRFEHRARAESNVALIFLSSPLIILGMALIAFVAYRARARRVDETEGAEPSGRDRWLRVAALALACAALAALAAALALGGAGLIIQNTGGG